MGACLHRMSAWAHVCTGVHKHAHKHAHAVCEVHAKLSWGGVAWVLRDMYSVNGTYLNGRLLRPFGACVESNQCSLSFSS